MLFSLDSWLVIDALLKLALHQRGINLMFFFCTIKLTRQNYTVQSRKLSSVQRVLHRLNSLFVCCLGKAAKLSSILITRLVSLSHPNLGHH